MPIGAKYAKKNARIALLQTFHGEAPQHLRRVEERRRNARGCDESRQQEYDGQQHRRLKREACLCRLANNTREFRYQTQWLLFIFILRLNLSSF